MVHASSPPGSPFRARMGRRARGACVCVLVTAMLSGTAWGQSKGKGNGKHDAPEISAGAMTGGLTLLAGGLLLLLDRARKKGPMRRDP